MIRRWVGQSRRLRARHCAGEVITLQTESAPAVRRSSRPPNLKDGPSSKGETRITSVACWEAAGAGKTFGLGSTVGAVRARQCAAARLVASLAKWQMRPNPPHADYAVSGIAAGAGYGRVTTNSQRVRLIPFTPGLAVPNNTASAHCSAIIARLYDGGSPLIGGLSTEKEYL